MPPRKRKAENRGLPKRWRQIGNVYYYDVPKGRETDWDGKRLFRLGPTLVEAYRVWAERLQAELDVTYIGDLLDRYAREVIPTKATATHADQYKAIERLKRPFGAMRLADARRRCLIEPHHAYQYFDRRRADKGPYSGKTAAKRELEVLSHALTMGVQWGYIVRNPLLGQLKITDKRVGRARRRYVADWEIDAVLALGSRRKKGSVLMVQAYIRLKLLTGLRRTDLLWLRVEDFKEDGLHVRPSKTASSSGVSQIFRYNDELRATLAMAKAARPVDIGPYLFCNRAGEPYIDERQKANGFESIWQRFMKRAVAETAMTEPFAERDLRAKAATDADSLEHARALLAHADARTTRQWYMRKPIEVDPGRGTSRPGTKK